MLQTVDSVLTLDREADIVHRAQCRYGRERSSDPKRQNATKLRSASGLALILTGKVSCELTEASLVTVSFAVLDIKKAGK